MTSDRARPPISNSPPTRAIVEYQSLATANTPVRQGRLAIWLKTKELVFRQRTVQMAILMLGWACIGFSLQLPAYSASLSYHDPRNAFSVWDCLVFGISGSLDGPFMAMAASCAGAIVVTPVLVLTRQPRTRIGQFAASAIIVGIVATRLLSLGGGPAPYFAGFYLAAFGCAITASSILLSWRLADSDLRPALLYLPLESLAYLEWPPIRRRYTTARPMAVTRVTSPDRTGRAFERTAVCSACIVLAGVALPFAFEYARRHNYIASNGDDGWASLGLFLLLAPGIAVFSLIGVTCAIVALAHRPRRIPALLAALICAGPALLFGGGRLLFLLMR